MPAESSDPTVIRSLAVTTADIVAALELTRTSDERAVLRVTPPFSGRMRARLHVCRKQEPTGDGQRTADPGTPRPLHIDPDRFVADPPQYPRPGDTEDELRADHETAYSVERHHEYHRAAVERWRETVPGTIRDRVTVQTAAGPHEVTVKTLQRDL